MSKETGHNKVYKKSIKNWPEDERQKEKLMRSGLLQQNHCI